MYLKNRAIIISRDRTEASASTIPREPASKPICPATYQATSVTDAQLRVRDLIESSLAALRVNVHSTLNTNAKIIDDWKELVDRFGPAVK